MPLHTHVFSFTNDAVVLSNFRCVHPKNQMKIFWFLHFMNQNKCHLHKTLRWSLEQSIALQLQCQTDLLLCAINCFAQWARLQTMAVSDLAFYYTLYLWSKQVTGKSKPHKKSWSNCSIAAIVTTEELQPIVMGQCMLIHRVCLSLTDN